MTERKVSVVVENCDPTLTYVCTIALLGLAVARSGASVADLERSEIAAGELIDVIEDVTPIVEVALTTNQGGFDLTLSFETAPAAILCDEGAQQVIGAGCSNWFMGETSATMSLSASCPSPNHD